MFFVHISVFDIIYQFWYFITFKHILKIKICILWVSDMLLKYKKCVDIYIYHLIDDIHNI